MSQQVSNYVISEKVDLNDLKLCLTFHYNITGRSHHQVLFFSVAGHRTWHSATTAYGPRYV